MSNPGAPTNQRLISLVNSPFITYSLPNVYDQVHLSVLQFFLQGRRLQCSEIHKEKLLSLGELSILLQDNTEVAGTKEQPVAKGNKARFLYIVGGAGE